MLFSILFSSSFSMTGDAFLLMPHYIIPQYYLSMYYHDMTLGDSLDVCVDVDLSVMMPSILAASVVAVTLIANMSSMSRWSW